MRAFLVACLLFTGPVVLGQPWQANWITPDTTRLTRPNTWFCFRREITVGNVPKRAIARIAVDTKYWLWVNGKLAVYEGGLKRGPTPRDTYVDSVDLAPFLKPGRNTVALLVWFWGGKGFTHHNSGRGGLLVDCPAVGLITDAGWKARVHPAYGSSDLSQPNYRLSEPMICYDARRELATKGITNWYEPAYNDATWSTARAVGRAGSAPWHELLTRPTPMFRNDGIRAYASTRRAGDTLIGTLPYNAHVSPRLRVKSPAGQRIVISSDTYFMGVESPTDSLYTLGATYITKAGEQAYESLGWLTGREIRYVVPKGVTVLGVDYRETGYDTRFAGNFSCSDSLLTRLWHKAQRTLYLNMRDQYMDCPDRERAQWIGDGALNMGLAFYALDHNSTALSRKFYHEFINWQRPDSVLYGPVPNEDWNLELPAQSLMALSEAARYFRHTHDTATVRLIYPAMRRYLFKWTLQPSGQLTYRKGGWDWGDWGENQDVALIQHGQYVLALQTAAQFAHLVGQPGDAAGYQQRERAIATYLNGPAVWTGQFYRSPAITSSPDDRGNALMVLAGVADSTKWPYLTDLMRMATNASPFMEKAVLESLFRMNQPQAALDRMRWRYRAMVESPLHTLWELWFYQPTRSRGNSGYNHAWAGGPLQLLSAYIAGIRPSDQPHHYLIEPLETDITTATATVAVKQGPIQVFISRSGAGSQYVIQLPVGTTAAVSLPVWAKTVQEGGKSVAVTGLPANRRILLAAGHHDLSINP